MKIRHRVAIAIIAGFGLGALAAEALHAQAPPPVYVVTLFDTADVTKTDYPSLDPATFQPFGGRYIIHFGRSFNLDGSHPRQVVVIKFDSIEKVRAWHASDAFKQAYDAHKASNVRAYAVEGVQ